jgi:hypothetical protein
MKERVKITQMNNSHLPTKIIVITFAMLFMVGCGTPGTTTTSTPVASAGADRPKPTVTLTLTTPPTETQIALPQATETQMIEAAPVAVLQGKFEGVGRDHTGSGTATVYQRSDGSYFLSFRNFTVCCGPDLYVFLKRKSSSADSTEIGNFIELSSLQAISGDQDYEIPAETDLSQIKSAVIYCKPYQVVIATATLNKK